jgi:hypothetical protein
MTTIPELHVLLHSPGSHVWYPCQDMQASQKTLPVAVAVISSGIGGSFGAEAAGLAAISAVRGRHS